MQFHVKRKTIRTKTALIPRAHTQAIPTRNSNPPQQNASKQRAWEGMVCGSWSCMWDQLRRGSYWNIDRHWASGWVELSWYGSKSFLPSPHTDWPISDGEFYYYFYTFNLHTLVGILKQGSTILMGLVNRRRNDNH